MNMKKLGTSGVQVSEMILGCWVMGGAQWGGADDNESIRAIHAAYDAGINTLDTAEAITMDIQKALSERRFRDIQTIM